MQSTGYTNSLAQPNVSITMFAPINEAFSAPVFVVSALFCTLTTIPRPITTRQTFNSSIILSARYSIHKSGAIKLYL